MWLQKSYSLCKYKIRMTCLFLFVFTSYIALGESEKILAKDVLMATVNGAPVTLSDVRSDTIPQERKLPMLYSGDLLKKEIEKLRHSALIFIIDRKLIYEQFEKRGYKVPKQIIEKMLDRLAANLAGGDRKLLESRARTSGVSMSDLREQAKERAATSLLLNARCYKPVYITPKKVYEYYELHKINFQKPARISLQILYLKCNPTDKSIANFAEKLRKEFLNSDEEQFAKSVKLHSQGPNRESGGKVGWIGEDKLRPEFITALRGKKVATIAGPIITDEGFYFIRISEREEAISPSFKQLKKEIREELTKQAEDKMYDKYISFLKRDAVIRIIKIKDF